MSQKRRDQKTEYKKLNVASLKIQQTEYLQLRLQPSRSTRQSTGGSTLQPSRPRGQSCTDSTLQPSRSKTRSTSSRTSQNATILRRISSGNPLEFMNVPNNKVRWSVVCSHHSRDRAGQSPTVCISVRQVARPWLSRCRRVTRSFSTKILTRFLDVSIRTIDVLPVSPLGPVTRVIHPGRHEG